MQKIKGAEAGANRAASHARPLHGCLEHVYPSAVNKQTGEGERSFRPARALRMAGAGEASIYAIMRIVVHGHTRHLLRLRGTAILKVAYKI